MVIIFISGIDAFIWTSKFIDILLTLFGILALAIGFIMIAFSFSVKQELSADFFWSSSTSSWSLSRLEAKAQRR